MTDDDMEALRESDPLKWQALQGCDLIECLPPSAMDNKATACQVWMVARHMAKFIRREVEKASNTPPAELKPHNKYARTIYPLQGEPVTIDVYRVLDAFGVTDPAIQHALKKLLMPGERGSKGVIQDLEEAAFSIKQAVELLKQKGGG